MQYFNDVFQHPKRQIIEKRLEIIKFFDDYGASACRRAFGKSRSTIYLWKQRLKGSGGKLSALAPGDRTPRRKRRRMVNPFIERFIVEYRSEHPGVDKTTITPALAVACARAGVKPVSESTVGRIIRDLKDKGRLPYGSKISIRGGTGTLMVKEQKSKKKKLRRKDYVPHQPGDLVQVDTVSIFTAGLKRYVFTALDVRTRFAFAYAYKTNSSANATDFIGKFLQVTPFATRRIQTDNGSELAHHFDDFCSKNGLTHFFNYPRHPQSNGFLERFNRTVQDQCVSLYIDYLDDPNDFNHKLMDYLIWYNTEKPHRGIGKIPPMKYYLDNFCPLQQSNMLWTLTCSCFV
jgi:transposase InsO family protein